MAGSDIAIVIPALNEAGTIADVVRRVAPHGAVFVVDDGSSDGTRERAAEAGATVVRHEHNQGYDGALNSGFAAAAAAGARHIITFDADGQHDAGLLPVVAARLHGGDDLVIGVRSSPARAAEWLFGFYTRLRFGLSDPLCGLKGYSAQLYRELGHFDSYHSIGTELMLHGMRSGKRFTTLAVPIAPRHGAPRFAQRWRANAKIARALWMAVIS